MQRIKTFRTFESVTGGLTPDQESWLDKCTRGRGTWSLNAEGLVDVEGSFDCSSQGLSDLKGVRFGKVSGDFSCSWNNLTSLVGAPGKVGGDFYCSYNKLTSLEGAPREVRGGFYCSENKLTSLEGSPLEVKGYFDCCNNNLTSLEGAPGKVGGDFKCYRNKLTSLEGAPEEVGGDFKCQNNPLQTLVGAPQKIGGVFRFSAGVRARQFEIPAGQWGPAGWVRALETIDDPKAKALVPTLLDPDVLNKLFRDQPEQTMIDLQGVWNVPEFAPTRKQLKVPERYRDDMDLLGDMKELGF
jgi:hypothetical protein